jgi:cysteine synthase A
VGKHRIQGISDEFVPSILDLNFLDGVIGVEDGDAILMAQKLASDLGIGIGISSGANFLGALVVQEQLGPDALVVTIFPDDNKKYLSTDLLRKEPIKDSFRSPHIKLIEVTAIKRVCYTCCNPTECMEVASQSFVSEEHLPHCPRRH